MRIGCCFSPAERNGKMNRYVIIVIIIAYKCRYARSLFRPSLLYSYSAAYDFHLTFGPLHNVYI